MHPIFSFFGRPSKLQRQSSLCHSCRYARIHHVPSFHTTNISQTIKQDSEKQDSNTTQLNTSLH